MKVTKMKLGKEQTAKFGGKRKTNHKTKPS